MNSMPDPRFEILKRLHELRLADYSQLDSFPGIPLVDVRAVLKTLIKEGYVDDRRSSRGPFSLTHAGVDYYYTLARSQQPLNETSDQGSTSNPRNSALEEPAKSNLKETLEMVGLVLSVLGSIVGIVVALGLIP